MFAAVELDLFTALGDGPATVEQIGRAIGVPSPRLRLLLNALVAADLLAADGERFANTPEAERYLVRGRPEFIEHRLEMLLQQLQTVQRSAESIRAGRPLNEADFHHMNDDALALYYRGTHPATLASASRLLAQHEFSNVERLLDAGGGTGGLAITFARALPTLSATVVELPRVAAITREFVREAGLEDRIDIVAQSFVDQPLTGAYDLAISRACLQVLSEDQVRRGILHIGEAVRPGGRLIIIGAILDDSRRTPTRAVHYNLLAINIYKDGEAYTVSQYQSWLEEAGFGELELAMENQDRLLAARKLR